MVIDQHLWHPSSLSLLTEITWLKHAMRHNTIYWEALLKPNWNNWDLWILSHGSGLFCLLWSLQWSHSSIPWGICFNALFPRASLGYDPPSDQAWTICWKLLSSALAMLGRSYPTFLSNSRHDFSFFLEITSCYLQQPKLNGRAYQKSPE